MKVKKFTKTATLKNGKKVETLKEKTMEETVQEWAKIAPIQTVGGEFTERDKELILKAWPRVRHEFLAKQFHISDSTLRRWYRKWTLPM